MWNNQRNVHYKLEVICKGRLEVKNTKIDILIHDYELFTMMEKDSIKDMFTLFMKIIKNQKYLDSLHELKTMQKNSKVFILRLET